MRLPSLVSALLGSFCPLLVLCGGVLLLPDSPLLLALAVLLWWLSLHPKVIPGTPGESVGLGLILGLVTLGKYHAFLVLLFPTLGVVLLLALLPRSGRDQAVAARQLLRWLVPAWWLLLPLAADWLAGLQRPRLRPWIVAGGWGTALLLPPLLLTLATQVLWGVFDQWCRPVWTHQPS
ncbi:hypothetical protein VB757_01275 [Synechococcus sp. BA-132 BA5]|nr:hypothetical protein [Synechococcus sp. BA-132 BA5]